MTDCTSVTSITMFRFVVRTFWGSFTPLYIYNWHKMPETCNALGHDNHCIVLKEIQC